MMHMVHVMMVMMVMVMMHGRLGVDGRGARRRASHGFLGERYAAEGEAESGYCNKSLDHDRTPLVKTPKPSDAV